MQRQRINNSIILPESPYPSTKRKTCRLSLHRDLSGVPSWAECQLPKSILRDKRRIRMLIRITGAKVQQLCRAEILKWILGFLISILMLSLHLLIPLHRAPSNQGTSIYSQISFILRLSKWVMEMASHICKRRCSCSNKRLRRIKGSIIIKLWFIKMDFKWLRASTEGTPLWSNF